MFGWAKGSITVEVRRGFEYCELMLRGVSGGRAGLAGVCVERRVVVEGLSRIDSYYGVAAGEVHRIVL